MDDKNAVCKYIQRQRKYRRTTYKKKSISIPTIKENGLTISSKIVIDFNKNTRTYSVSWFGIRYNKHDIYPTTNNKLSCSNVFGIEAFKKYKEGCKTRNYGIKEFRTKIDTRTYLRERIKYDQKQNTINYYWGVGLY